jgi:hypothetical protein
MIAVTRQLVATNAVATGVRGFKLGIISPMRTGLANATRRFGECRCRASHIARRSCVFPSRNHAPVVCGRFTHSIAANGRAVSLEARAKRSVARAPHFVARQKERRQRRWLPLIDPAA